jgi:hypothetical protein
VKQKTFFSVCFGVFETTEPNRTLSKQTEKIAKKHCLLGVLETVNFFSRFEPKQTETQSVSVVFRFVFSRKQKFVFRFVSLFQTGIETTETNRTYGMGN